MPTSFRIGEWLVDPRADRIVSPDETVHIEPRAMQALVYLAEHAGEVVTRDEILRAVWEETFVADEVLTSAIAKLRRAFGDEGTNPTFIQTVPKKGYRLNASVSPAEQQQDRATPIPRRMGTIVTLGVAVFVVGAGTYLFTNSTPPDPTPSLNVKLFTSSVGVERYPTWSPDGSLIAYERPQAGNTDIFVKPASGGEPIQPPAARRMRSLRAGPPTGSTSRLYRTEVPGPKFM